MVSRDSWVLWLGIAGSIVAYLVASENPMLWHYDDWMKFAALLIGVISGKLATSPLPGANDGTKASAASVTKLVPVVLLCLMLPLAGCAPSFQAKLQQADAGIAGALKLLDGAEQSAYTSGALTADQHKQFSKNMVPALSAGLTFHASVLSYKPGAVLPLDVLQIATAMHGCAEVLRTVAPSPQRDKIAAIIDSVAIFVNSALALLLPQSQAETLMLSPVFAH